MSTTTSSGKLTLWLLDTRSLWPGTSIKESAAAVLPLIPTGDRVTVLRKHHAADARMSLASSLLKRLYISQTLSVPWSSVAIRRRHDPRHGKPAALLLSGSFANLDFNISHQAGLVTLIGFAPSDATSPLAEGKDPAVLVGTDITCVNERDDYRTVDAEGVDGFVEIFADVFSDTERFEMSFGVDSITLLDGRVVDGADLDRAGRIVNRGQEVKLQLPSTDGQGQEVTFDSEAITDAKMRRFYAYFALKEAYVKLTGEALLAPWLKELEFSEVKSPRPGAPARCSTLGMSGGREEGMETWFRGQEVKDTQMDLRAYDESFMIASAIKGDAGLKLGDCDTKVLDINEVLEYARTH
ncbi:4'-phosphopantetheinyl transferase-like protein [Elsinoe fawcettii]|nr:4'-phosphopantetheinyl transferase-like protein [Elsinoe fawcettii]